MTDPSTRPADLVRRHRDALFAWVAAHDPDELDRLLDADYSRVTFGLGHPFVRRTRDIGPAEHRRYWVAEHEVLGERVRVTNDWYDRNVPDLIAYLAAIGVVDDVEDLTVDERQWSRPVSAPSDPAPAHPPATVALDSLSTSELLALQAATIAELRKRSVLRAGAAPAGDLAELLVHRALAGSTLADPAEKAFDVIDPTWGRVQVKSRTVSDPPRPGQLQTGTFRSDAFDHAVLVLLDEATYEVVRAVLLPVDAVRERWGRRDRVNGWALMMNGPTMRHAAAADITGELRVALSQLA